MGSKLPTTLLRRPLLTTTTTKPTTPSSPVLTTPLQSQICLQQIQVRHATFVPRHRRPYHFTQLVQLSDGSTFTVRTTMPQALYKSNKDSRSHVLWQPTEKSLKNLEVDEAGKLAAFRDRFGRGWDMDSVQVVNETEKPEGGKQKGKRGAAAAKAEPLVAASKAEAAVEEEDAFDSLVDLISEYAKEDGGKMGGMSAKEAEKADKKRK
ncbi:hypothetical protein OQA88_6557 [Cercophora sp. LCS_1]